MVLSTKIKGELTGMRNELDSFYQAGERTWVPSVTTVLSHTPDLPSKMRLHKYPISCLLLSNAAVAR